MALQRASKSSGFRNMTISELHTALGAFGQRTPEYGGGRTEAMTLQDLRNEIAWREANPGAPGALAGDQPEPFVLKLGDAVRVVPIERK